jgi:HEAT repeat protein
MKNPAAIYRVRRHLPETTMPFDRTILFLLIALWVPASAISAQAQKTSRVAQSPPGTAELIQGLQSHDPARREQAAKAAAGTKPLPPAVVPFLLNSFTGLPSQLWNNDPSISEATRMKLHELWFYSGYLVQALANAGPQAIPQLSLALDNHDEAIRKGAVDALMLIAKDSPAAWPTPISPLGNPHPDVPHRVEETIATG